MRIHALAAMTILALSTFGCSGGDDEGESKTVDAAIETVDAMPPQPDAEPETVGFGQSCTPTAEDPTGGCPTDFACVGIDGGNTPFCTIECTVPLMVAECSAHTGPCLGACVIGSPPEMPGPDYCGIICQLEGCPANVCDGTCPGDLECVVTEGQGLCQ